MTRGISLSFSYSSSFSSLFCRLPLWQVAHLQSSRCDRLRPRLVVQSRFQDSSCLMLPLHCCCPLVAHLSFLCFISSRKYFSHRDGNHFVFIILHRNLHCSSLFFIDIFIVPHCSSHLVFNSMHYRCSCPPAAALLLKTDFRNRF